MCVTYRSSKLGVNLIALAWHWQFFYDQPSVLAKINKTLLMKNLCALYYGSMRKVSFIFPSLLSRERNSADGQ